MRCTCSRKARRSRPARPRATGVIKELTGLHMQNFFDCVRSRKEPVCPFELGFRTVDRLPDGGRLLPPAGDRALGPGDGRDYLIGESRRA